MYLYDDVTAVAAAPAAPAAGGAPGYFSDGAPGVAPRSVIRAWIINLMMKELMSPVLAAGLTPSRTDGTQLLQAIQILAVPGAATTTHAGTVLLADDATALAGTDAAKAVTPHALHAVVNALINGAPGALDTLKELADALADDPNFATTITNALALKAPLASPALSGAPTAPTPATDDNSTKLATTAWVRAAIAALVPMSLGANGYINLFGLILQWGYRAGPLNESSIVVAPSIPFPAACVYAAGSALNAGPDLHADVYIQTQSLTATSVTFYADASTSANNITGFYYVMIGY